MSLQFVMGPSGSGKSHYLYQMVTEESLKNPDKNYLVIVPEQFTLQTQKDLVLASPRKGILNVDVLSFNRLAHRVFEETGANQSIILDDVGKSFIIRKIAGDYEKQLEVLGGNLKKPGFVNEMKSVISEFTQYDIQKEDLEKVIEGAGEGTGFSLKLQDLLTVYEGFQEYLEGKYITGEELLEVLCKAVPKSKLLKDSIVVLDGFTGFTPVQEKLLAELFTVCEKVVVTMTVDPAHKKDALFEMSREMETALIKKAKECRISIEVPIFMEQNPVYRFKNNSALGFLESHIFRYSKEKFEEEQDAVQIYNADTVRDEADFVAQSIRRFVREKGLRYRDIAVIASDMNTYANHMERAFDNYGIPTFTDYKRSILLNSFVEYLRSLLAMVEQNFSYEGVFRYLRTNLAGFTREEVDILENYCVALGIHGYKKWQEKWLRRTKGMTEDDLSLVNAYRERFLKSLEEILPILKKRSKTVEEVTRALHDFLYKNEIQKKVQEYEKQFEQDKELVLEREYAQVYRIVMELFDKFVELLGDERISLRDYCDLLDAGFEEAKVGVIPPGLDQVVIGDIERTRIKDIKVLFFVGMNDVHIPGNTEKGGLLSEYDREKMKESGMKLAPGAKEKSFIQKFYLYLLLTKPTDKVVLSYCKTGADGKKLRQAYLISDLLKMYPKLSVQKVEKTIGLWEFTPKTAIPHLAEGLRNKYEEPAPAWKELYTWYQKNPEWSKTIEQLVEAAFYRKPSTSLTKGTAEKLYGTILNNSVSRLEQFSRCAYAHFLSYGLKLRERELYQFKTMDLGTVFHNAIEGYSRKLQDAGYRWKDVPDAQQEALIAESVQESVADYGNNILHSSSRNAYMSTRVERLVKRTVWAVTKQLEKGDFEPVGFEVAYNSNVMKLQDENRMKLYGKIDRVDICETEEDVYVKIVDYKTGSKKFSLNELYHGLQMQLVVYMNAVVKAETRKHRDKNVTPAGILYYTVDDPVVEKQETDDARESEILKKLRPNGMVNRDAEIISHLDATLQTQWSTVIPVAKKADGSLYAKSSVLSTEELQVLEDFATKKMIEIGNEIVDGNVAIEPYKLDGNTPCQYCEYKGICGFDEKIPGYQYRKLQKFEQDEVIAKMREEE